MAGNLTRDEARERAALIEVESTSVELDLTTGDETFMSTSVIVFRCARPGAATFVDLVAPIVRDVVLNDVHLDPAQVFDGGRINLPELAEHNELRVVAGCAYMRTGEGLHRFVDPVDDKVYLHSQFETTDAHRMYACFDQPDLKTRFRLTVTAPEDWQVVSNWPTEEDPEPTPGDASKRIWRFQETPELSPYVTAMVAGHYHVVRDEHDGIPLGIYCRASMAEYLDADELFEVTKQGFDFYHRVFERRYPFAKYDQLFVPEFNAGAMENAGCVTILEDYIFRSRVTDAPRERRASTILHEMAHMWFGDLVTMRWWDDLWLNESFATYMSTLAQAEVTRWTTAWTTFANVEKAWAYRQDQLPSTHPIAADIPDVQAVEVNFDGITYAKGASVLKQLVAYVGREEFFAGVRDYFAAHAWGNTSLTDLLSALERTSGRDLAAWSKEWLEAAGVNTLRPVFHTDADGRITSFAVRQEAPAEHPTLRTHRIGIGLYDTDGEGLARRRHIELDISGELTEVAELVGEQQADLVLLNDDDLTYAKVRLDERSLRTVVETIGGVGQSLPRSLMWSSAWDMTRDAEMTTRDYVQLTVAGIGGVTDLSVAQSLLHRARLACQQFADPAWRPTGLALLADTTYDLLQHAEPGSDLQLAYAQEFIRLARTEEHLAVISGLLDGSRVIDGLTVDADLRWSLLLRLVETGNAGEPEIDAEMERDATATGQRHGAQARAAIPTPTAKAETWDELLHSSELTNAVFRARAAGLVDPDHPELMVPFVAKYFDVVGEVWKTWTQEMAQFFAEYFYPFLVIDPTTVEATDTYIARHDPPASLRRLLLEGRASVERALRARQVDAGG